MDIGNAIFGGIVIGAGAVLLLLCIIWAIESHRDLKRFEKRLKDRRKREEERHCGNCKHADKDFREEPCANCLDLNEWEAEPEDDGTADWITVGDPAKPYRCSRCGHKADAGSITGRCPSCKRRIKAVRR